MWWIWSRMIGSSLKNIFFLKCTCLVDNLRCYKYRGNSTKISIKKKDLLVHQYG